MSGKPEIMGKYEKLDSAIMKEMGGHPKVFGAIVEPASIAVKI
jgi:hypothetical protein